jgi:hypothetical protein
MQNGIRFDITPKEPSNLLKNPTATREELNYCTALFITI